MSKKIGSVFVRIEADTKPLYSTQKQVSQYASFVQKQFSNIKAYSSTAFNGIKNASRHFASPAMVEMQKLNRLAQSNFPKMHLVASKTFKGIKRIGSVSLKALIFPLKTVKNVGVSVFKQLSQSVSSFASTLITTNPILAGLSAIMAGGAVVKQADDYVLLEERVKSTTKATKDFSIVFERLEGISKTTGTALASNVRLFETLSASQKELGTNNIEVLRLTEAIGQLGIMTGASTDAMSNSMVQFSQAMGQTYFRTEEFQSVFENTPGIARRIAQGMGMSLGAVRELVRNGKLLSKNVFEALLKQSTTISQEFQSMPATLSKSLASLKANAISALHDFNQFAGFTSKLATGIDFVVAKVSILGNTIKSVFNKITSQPLYAWFKQQFSKIKNILYNIYSGYVNVFANIASFWAKSTETMGRALYDNFPLSSWVLWVGKKIGQVISTFLSGIETMSNYWKNFASRFSTYYQMACVKIEQNITHVTSYFKMAWIKSIDSIKNAIGSMLSFFGEKMSKIPLIGQKFDFLKKTGQYIKNNANRTADWQAQVDKLNKSYDVRYASLLNINRALDKQSQHVNASVIAKPESQEPSFEKSQGKQSDNIFGSSGDDGKNKNENEAENAGLIEKYASKEAFFSNHLANKSSLIAGYNEQKKESEQVEDEAENERRLLKNEQDLLALQQHFLALDELELLRFQKQQEILKQALNNKKLTLQEFQDLEYKTTVEHNAKIATIQRNQSTALTKLKGLEGLSGVNLTTHYGDKSVKAHGQVLRKTFSQAVKGSKYQFQIMKTAELAKHALSVPSTLRSAYAWGMSMGGLPVAIATSIAAGAAMASYGFQLTKSIFKAPSSTGGLRSGGVVHSNRMYEVNESGVELFSTNSRDYLLSKTSGQVTSNDKLKQFHSNPNITIEFKPNITIINNTNHKLDFNVYGEIDDLVIKIDQGIANLMNSNESEILGKIEDRLLG